MESCGASARRLNSHDAASTLISPGPLSGSERSQNGQQQQQQQQQIFSVGKLLAEKSENGVAHFKVRWKNFPPTSDTWEPETNLTAVADMVQEFRRRGPSSSATNTTNSTSIISSTAASAATSKSTATIVASTVGSVATASNAISTTSTATTSSSNNNRKRNASRRWDVVPASELVASKTKFYNDLEAGRIDIGSNDLYSRVKCRRRANGDSESAASDLEDDDDACASAAAPAATVSSAATATSVDTTSSDQSLSIADQKSIIDDQPIVTNQDSLEKPSPSAVVAVEDEEVDDDDNDCQSNNSDTGSCFAANSVGSSSTVEMDESRPNRIVGQTVLSGSSEAAAASAAAAVAPMANNSASSCDSGCPVTPPKNQQQQQLQQQQRHQKSLLNDLLLSAKRQRFHRHLTREHRPEQKQQLLQREKQKRKTAKADYADTDDEENLNHFEGEDLEEEEEEDFESDNEFCDNSDYGARPDDDASSVSIEGGVSSQVELLRAHLAGESSRIASSIVLQRRHKQTAAPLGWTALCQAVERGDWPAVQRTLTLLGTRLNSASSKLLSSTTAAASSAAERLTPDSIQRLLCLAASRGHARLVDLLLNKAPLFCRGQNLDVNFLSPDPSFGAATPLMLAVDCDSLATVHRLLSAGANPDFAGASGASSSSALHRAIRNRRPILVDALCSRGGANFGSDTCDGLTPLKFARRACPQSAAILQRYVGQLCRSMHDLVTDHLGRLGFDPAALLFAPQYVRPGASETADTGGPSANRTWSMTFQLPADEAASPGHALALIHCCQQPKSQLLTNSHHQRQLQHTSVTADQPLSLHCWLADGPCHVTGVFLNGQRQLSLSVNGDQFLVGLNGCVEGENRLQLTFARYRRSSQRLAKHQSSVRDPAATSINDLRIGVFAMRIVERGKP